MPGTVFLCVLLCVLLCVAMCCYVFLCVLLCVPRDIPGMPQRVIQMPSVVMIRRQ
jgi:hypothetical protein